MHGTHSYTHGPLISGCLKIKHTHVNTRAYTHITQLRYVWLKKVSKESKLEWYVESDDGKLTFDPLTHENEGYYICQAEITSQHADSEEVYVKGRIRPKRSVGKRVSDLPSCPLLHPHISACLPLALYSFHVLLSLIQVYFRSPRSLVPML